ncbi:hypothetical protein TKK_0003856 [Trichogramma kaykai]|uniref:GH18 domain-containing protein n=1 Tax=Trichogramma kaykai TaxID=54128 RepID=A0ABD2XNA1_9HYME
MLPRITLLLSLGLVLVSGYQDDYSSNYNRPTTNESHTAVFCYVNGTRLVSQSRRNTYQTGHFGVESIKVELCTHIVYGAAVLEPNSWDIRAIDPDLEHRQSSGNKISFDDITELKNRKRDLKVLISVSGTPTAFSQMAKSHREVFVQHAKTFLNKYKFDGLNIDWQYPTRRGGTTEDKQNFGLLIKELKIMFRNEAKLLTASISPMRQTVINGYEYMDGVVMESVDYWFILATEYYGHWSNRIGPNAPLRSRENLGVEKTIDDLKYLFQKHAYKLVLVVPFYGKKFQLRSPLQNNYESPIGKDFVNMHAPAENVILSYREICQKMSNEQWRRGWDSDSETPYIVKDAGAIVFDDAQSVQAKTSMALRRGLGGVMAFSIDMDDFDGDCSDGSGHGRRGGSSSTNAGTNSDGYNYNWRDRSARKYPLLQIMYDTVERGPNSAGLGSASLLLVTMLAAIVALLNLPQ